MAKTLRLPFFEKATLTYRAGKMILVSQYGDGGRMETVYVQRNLRNRFTFKRFRKDAFNVWESASAAA